MYLEQNNYCYKQLHISLITEESVIMVGTQKDRYGDMNPTTQRHEPHAPNHSCRVVGCQSLRGVPTTQKNASRVLAFDIRLVAYHRKRLQLCLTEQDDVILVCLPLPNLSGLQCSVSLSTSVLRPIIFCVQLLLNITCSALHATTLQRIQQNSRLNFLNCLSTSYQY